MNCIMYSILVNPTHAVTGALAPSSPLFGFIFSFSRDLIFFSFSLFLTPLRLCAGDRPIYLIDFAPVLPPFHRSPLTHTHLLCPIDPGSFLSVTSSLSIPPPPPTQQVYCFLLVLSAQLRIPRERPSRRPSFPPVEFLLSYLEREQGLGVEDASQRREKGSLFSIQD